MNNMDRSMKLKKSNERKFYEKFIRRIGMIILHSVGATVFILITILLGVGCATSGGHWVYLLSLIICIAITIFCTGAVVVDICHMLFFAEGLYNNKREY